MVHSRLKHLVIATSIEVVEVATAAIVLSIDLFDCHPA